MLGRKRNDPRGAGVREEGEGEPRRPPGPGARAKAPLREVHGWGLNGYLEGTPRNVVPGTRLAGWFHTGRDSERDIPTFREGGPAS